MRCACPRRESSAFLTHALPSCASSFSERQRGPLRWHRGAAQREAEQQEAVTSLLPATAACSARGCKHSHPRAHGGGVSRARGRPTPHFAPSACLSVRLGVRHVRRTAHLTTIDRRVENCRDCARERLPAPGQAAPPRRVARGAPPTAHRPASPCAQLSVNTPPGACRLSVVRSRSSSAAHPSQQRPRAAGGRRAGAWRCSACHSTVPEDVEGRPSPPSRRTSRAGELCWSALLGWRQRAVSPCVCAGWRAARWPAARLRCSHTRWTLSRPG